MRYVGEWYQVSIALRYGMVTVVELEDVLATAAQSTVLEPAVIGRMAHQAAHPKPGIGRLGWRYEARAGEKFAIVAGARGESDFVNTAATLALYTDGFEARISSSINQQTDVPADGGIEYAGLSTREIRERIDKGLLEWEDLIVDTSTPENRTGIAPWHDPEMLGQAILNTFRLTGPLNNKPDKSPFDPRIIKGRNKLHKAAVSGEVGTLPKSNRSGRSFDPPDSEGITPLMLAAACGNTETVERLLALGADTTLVDNRGRGVLHHAAAASQPSVIEALLKEAAIIPATDEIGRTPLHEAALNGRLETARLLLEMGADPNIADTAYRSTPLHLSARGNHPDLIPTLANYGADIGALNEGGKTPLHVAAAYGYPEVVRALLDVGANVNTRDIWGQSPLHSATFFQHLDCVELLIRSDADLGATDDDGHTPLHIAAIMNRDQAAGLLMESGADTETANHEGMTAIDLALISPHYRGDSYLEHNSEVVLTLLKGGATIRPDRIPLPDRHVLWPHLTPREHLLDGDDIDPHSLSRLPESIKKSLAGMSEDDSHKRNSTVPFGPAHGAESILHDAARKGMADLIGRLLTFGVSPETAVRYKGTPLHIAAEFGDIEVAEVLLEGGADLEAPWINTWHEEWRTLRDTKLSRYTSECLTPLDQAIELGNAEMMRFLLDRGAVPPQSYEELWGQSLSHPLPGCPLEFLQAVMDVFDEYDIPSISKENFDDLVKDKKRYARLVESERRREEAWLERKRERREARKAAGG